MKKLALIFLALTFFTVSWAYIFVARKTNTLSEVSKQQPYIPPTKELNAPTIDELLQLTNAERTKEGVAPLVIDSRLNTSAQAKSAEMHTSNYYDHTSPITGKSGGRMAYEAMPECKYLSENLDAAKTSQEVITEWMGSQSHRQALLDSRYDYVGFGITKHLDYFYIVQHFCDLP